MSTSYELSMFGPVDPKRPPAELARDAIDAAERLTTTELKDAADKASGLATYLGRQRGLEREARACRIHELSAWFALAKALPPVPQGRPKKSPGHPELFRKLNKDEKTQIGLLQELERGEAEAYIATEPEPSRNGLEKLGRARRRERQGKKEEDPDRAQVKFNARGELLARLRKHGRADDLGGTAKHLVLRQLELVGQSVAPGQAGRQCPGCMAKGYDAESRSYLPCTNCGWDPKERYADLVSLAILRPGSRWTPAEEAFCVVQQVGSRVRDAGARIHWQDEKQQQAFEEAFQLLRDARGLLAQVLERDRHDWETPVSDGGLLW